jgi:signal transduction histidine kinase
MILVYRRQRIYRELTDQLQQANESKERLLSVISHDLRSSIGTLRTAAKVISEGITDMDDTRDLLESFYPVADSTYDLLENMLTWAKCNTKKITPEFFDINLKEIIEKAIEHTHHLADSKSIDIINTLSDQIVSADKNMILSVARNILHNAIKFSHQKSKVIISSEIKNGLTIVSVSDNGIGMEPNHLKKIFENPEDIQTTGTMGERGSGLGIMICKTFLQSHGGDIWAESTPGKGTTFFFSLPIKN